MSHGLSSRVGAGRKLLVETPMKLQDKNQEKMVSGRRVSGRRAAA